MGRPKFSKEKRAAIIKEVKDRIDIQKRLFPKCFSYPRCRKAVCDNVATDHGIKYKTLLKWLSEDKRAKENQIDNPPCTCDHHTEIDHLEKYSAWLGERLDIALKDCQRLKTQHETKLDELAATIEQQAEVITGLDNSLNIANKSNEYLQKRVGELSGVLVDKEKEVIALKDNITCLADDATRLETLNKEIVKYENYFKEETKRLEKELKEAKEKLKDKENAIKAINKAHGASCNNNLNLKAQLSKRWSVIVVEGLRELLGVAKGMKKQASELEKTAKETSGALSMSNEDFKKIIIKAMKELALNEAKNG
jgi:chromosome segregation ATPase